MLIASAWLFQDLAPGIVNVPGGMPTVAVPRRDQVALKVQNIVVDYALICQRVRLAGVAIDDIQRIAAPSLAHDLTVLGAAVMGFAANGLAVPDSCQIVGVVDTVATLSSLGELSYGTAGGLGLRHQTFIEF